MNTASRWPSERDLAGVVGSRIRQEREHLGLSQRQLASQVDLSRSMIAKYEGGVHTPPVSTLIRLAAVLHVTIDGLLGRPGLEPSLGRFLQAVERMDEPTRRSVLDALDRIVKAYQTLFGGLQSETH
jgi:transcriptional regulator with XRE-family HTH domain